MLIIKERENNKINRKARRADKNEKKSSTNNKMCGGA
jgi:hypothetical protein